MMDVITYPDWIKLIHVSLRGHRNKGTSIRLATQSQIINDAESNIAV